ncbi:MAG: sugar phosphate isomerase/epimerase [Chitinophagaceae bacterium]|nr:sugar phosphate isomerase/epimerase [Chitinophagaceae bacterium]
MKNVKRRYFLRSFLTLSALTSVGQLPAFSSSIKKKINNKSSRFKISLNAYSFNDPLRNNKTNLDAVIEFCAKEGFDAVDLTGYYFPGYPEIPDDEYIFHLKRKAHELGVGISGTGIRNDFITPFHADRPSEIAWVRQWIEVAAKLGAPVIRIYTGRAIPDNFTREQVTAWVVDDIKQCAEHGKKHGVIVAIQNHNDFIKTADQAIDIIKKVNSEWFGLVLDTGSFVTNEPYSEIQKAAPYAVNWQVKERLNYNGKNEAMDLEKLFSIITASAYRGYLPIETLTPGDPFIIIPAFLKMVKAALEKVTA